MKNNDKKYSDTFENVLPNKAFKKFLSLKIKYLIIIRIQSLIIQL